MNENAITEALNDITRMAISLYDYYADAKRRAEQAMAALDNAKMPDRSYSGGFGALGHQLPFDITSKTEQLNGAVQLALALGATDEQIEDAMKKASESPYRKLAK